MGIEHRRFLALRDLSEPREEEKLSLARFLQFPLMGLRRANSDDSDGMSEKHEDSPSDCTGHKAVGKWIKKDSPNSLLPITLLLEDDCSAAVIVWPCVWGPMTARKISLRCNDNKSLTNLEFTIDGDEGALSGKGKPSEKTYFFRDTR